VDVVVESGETLVPLEIKSGGTVVSDYFSGLDRWFKMTGDAAKKARLVYGGDHASLRDNVEVIPWRDIDEIADSL
jgi:hypothetical protein